MMSRVLTNNTTLSYAIEESIGILPASPTWFTLEPNALGTYGATITTVARDPISRNRQRRKGTVTDLDSAVDWDGDLTLSHLVAFVEAFCFATAVNQDLDFLGGDTTSTGFTVDTLVQSQVDKLHYTASGPISLIFSRGYLTTSNEGLFALNAQPALSDTELMVDGLTPETAPTNAVVDIAGIRAFTGDLTINVNTGPPATAVINSTDSTNPVDFTTLGLTVGQFIHVGGLTPAEQFTDSYGYGRITSISTSQLDLDKIDTTLVTVADSSADTVDLLFGRFVRNVPTNSTEFLERSIQYELTYPDLGGTGTDEYEYAKGNFINTLALSMPLADKATVSFASIGTDAQPPTPTRATNAVDSIDPSRTGAFNTTSDCARLRIAELDDSGIYTDFKSLTVTFSNNVSPEKVLCNLGAKYMNFGNFEVNIEAQMIFSNSAVAEAVRNNTTLTMDFGLHNDDGTVFFDIPAITVGGGDREFPVNETVLINTTGEAFADPVLNTSIGISLFPVTP